MVDAIGGFSGSIGAGARLGSFGSAAPPPATDSGGRSTLRIGSTGPGVANVQRQLVKAGEQLEANGQFGPRTEAAVRRFQLARGIRPADGTANPRTQAALAAVVDGFDAAPRRPAGMPVLNPGMPALNPEQIRQAARLPTLNEQLAQGVADAKHTAAMNRAGVREPQGPAQTRQAELRTVPAGDQERVQGRVRRTLERKLSELSPYQRERLQPLVDSVGKPDFYNKLAMIDPSHASGWRQMAGVQAAFAGAESGYDPQTRAYSESMRLTLHTTAVLQLASDPQMGRDHYDDFIAAHVTAFRENGGWFTNLKIGMEGSFEVLRNTPWAMAANAGTLVGAVDNDDPSARTGAEIVRRARADVIDNPIRPMI
jgi:peptidoglycan hydrolase-like protein with peptidoglycan-binding domain